MKNRIAEKLFEREERLRRELDREKEHYMELVEAAMSTGSFRYDQDKVTGSLPDGSRVEQKIVDYVELEQKIRKKAEDLAEVQMNIRILVGTIEAPRIRKVMQAIYVEHNEKSEIMQQQEISEDTLRDYEWRGIDAVQKMIDGIQKI